MLLASTEQNYLQTKQMPYPQQQSTISLQSSYLPRFPLLKLRFRIFSEEKKMVKGILLALWITYNASSNRHLGKEPESSL